MIEICKVDGDFAAPLTKRRFRVPSGVFEDCSYSLEHEHTYSTMVIRERVQGLARNPYLWRVEKPFNSNGNCPKS